MIKESILRVKLTYLLICVLYATFLFGCKEQGEKITVFDGLPESTYLSEMKTAIETKKPIAVSFTAEWCPHCRKYKPVFFEVKDLYQNKVTFININVDDNEGSAISERFQVKGIPTTAFIRQDGTVFKVQVGEIEKDKLIEIADDLIKSKKKKRSQPVAPFPIEPVEVKAPPKEEAPQEIIKEESIQEQNDEEESEKPKEVIEELKPQDAQEDKAIPQEENNESEETDQTDEPLE